MSDRDAIFMTIETCANCADSIGRLETPFIWRDRIVCAGCYEKLSQGRELATDMPEPSSVMLEYASLPAPAKPIPVLGPGDIICPNPNCGYIGLPDRKSKGSTLVMVLLMLLWIIPGFIYAIVYSGHTLNCPKCGIKIRDE